MKILVCVSNVPDTTTKITFSSDNTQFNTAGVQFILNPYDEIALAKAIELSEGGNSDAVFAVTNEIEDRLAEGEKLEGMADEFKMKIIKIMVNQL